MSSREERLARNEALFREVNESVRGVHDDWSAIAPESGAVRVVCECSDDSCTETIDLAPDAYAAVRENPLRFILLPGHEDPSIERIVGESDGHLVVEKTGEGAEVARRL
jgi:hypothetical protein